jgi:iron complex outermembrane receptor protein
MVIQMRPRAAHNGRLSAISLAVSLACTPAVLYAQDDADADAAMAADVTETVIVTGTRTTGLDEYTSNSPVQVLSAEELESAGRPDLMSSLANVVPSFTAQAFGGDMANQTLQAKMRGLSPNHTLVLVNGKRRHTTGSLAILGGPVPGRRGCRPQFHPGGFHPARRSADRGRGRAIRHRRHRRRHQPHHEAQPVGRVGELLARRLLRRRRRYDDLQRQPRLEATAGSYLSLTAEYREHGHTNRGDIDPRVVDPARIDPDEAARSRTPTCRSPPAIRISTRSSATRPTR